MVGVWGVGGCRGGGEGGRNSFFFILPKIIAFSSKHFLGQTSSKNNQTKSNNYDVQIP